MDPVLLAAVVALAALVVALLALAYALDCREDRDRFREEASAALHAVDAERALKVEAMQQLRTLRQRICVVCSAEDTYGRRRVVIASVPPPAQSN